MTAEEMRRYFSDKVGEAGGVRLFCDLHGIDHTAVYLVLKGENVSKRLAAIVGCEREFVYTVRKA